jgi:hypothetical protein
MNAGWAFRLKTVSGKHLEKKSRAQSPAPKIVSTLFPRDLDLILIDGATLLVRARGSSRDLDHQTSPSGQPEALVVDDLFRLVTIFGNDCSKFEQSEK